MSEGVQFLAARSRKVVSTHLSFKGGEFLYFHHDLTPAIIAIC